MKEDEVKPIHASNVGLNQRDFAFQQEIMKINSLRESMADHKNKIYRDKFVINSKTATVLSTLLVYPFVWTFGEEKLLYSVKTEQQFPLTMPYRDYQQRKTMDSAVALFLQIKQRR
uniref:Uncharacterized protein n=1 Tax=Glossina austeni TaxID=7395 RepID=A0A1A9VA59_GLOAU